MCVRTSSLRFWVIRRNEEFQATCDGQRGSGGLEVGWERLGGGWGGGGGTFLSEILSVCV